MNIRRPTDKVSDIRDAIFDIIDGLSNQTKSEIKTVDVIAIASTTVSVPLTSVNLTKVNGAIQIAGTMTEIAYINYKNSTSVIASWAFGASTSGKQTATFLLIGS